MMLAKEIFLRKLMKHLSRIWYSYISRIDKNSEATFLNYGYVDNEKEVQLLKNDEGNRYPIQLYNHVATAITLEGLDVLEVGCGRGGGTSFIARYLKPRSIIGVDLCKKSINFCNKYYSISGLSFSWRDALNLLFKDENFHVVINVESSHWYEDINRFFNEVHRVLKPNGYFLFADFRNRKSIPHLKEQLKKSQFNIIKEEIITPNVIKALDIDNARRLELIRKLVPKFLHKFTKNFSGIKGSKRYKSFVTGEKEYFYFVLKYAASH